MKLYFRDYEDMADACQSAGVGPAQRHAGLDPRGSVPRSRSAPDDLHSPTCDRRHFSSAVKTPSQVCGGASIWNRAIRRRYRS
jgi:hypothetical protein